MSTLARRFISVSMIFVGEADADETAGGGGVEAFGDGCVSESRYINTFFPFNGAKDF